MTNEEIVAWQKEQKLFAETKVGGLFFAFERAHAHAWIKDCQEGIGDAKLKKAWDDSNKARLELIAAIKELQS